MTKVKICGLTRLPDIQIVNDLKPDYVGFVFAPSRRQISLERGKELASLLNENIQTVGVFVNSSIQQIKEAVEQVKLDVVQLHGQESKNYIKELYEILPESTKIWRKIGIPAELRTNGEKNGASYIENELEKYLSVAGYIDAYLLDTGVKGQEGGTGKTFDWNLVKDTGRKHKIVLAGGLSIDNVQKAIELVHPYCVDVSTHVETDGFKDKDKIALFLRKVRALKR